MRNPLAGSLGAALGGDSAAVKNGNEMWMSWLESGSADADIEKKTAAAVETAKNGGLSRVSGGSLQHLAQRHAERFTVTDRDSRVNRTGSDSSEESEDERFASSADERYSSMRQEIELAQRRLAVRERIISEPNLTSSVPSLTVSESPVVILQRAPQSDKTPPLPSMALWGSTVREHNTPQTPETISIADISNPFHKAAVSVTLESALRRVDAVDSIVHGAIGPFSVSEALRGPDSESSKLLAQHKLYDKFSGINCHEHISWGPDGSVSVALKSADGYRRTIVCRPDGTSAQRVTNPDGQEIFRFSSSGQVTKCFDSGKSWSSSV